MDTRDSYSRANLLTICHGAFQPLGTCAGGSAGQPYQSERGILYGSNLKPESPAGLILGETGQIPLETLEIDQEAFFTTLPIGELQRIGAPSHPLRIRIDREDGRRVESPVYSIRLSVGGRTSNTLAVAFEGARPVLGSKSLEDLGMQINRRSGLLEPSRNSHFLST